MLTTRRAISLMFTVLGLGCSTQEPTPEHAAGGGQGGGGQGGGGQGGGGGMAGPAAVWPLSGVEAELPVEELAPFAELVADAEVIGIGESVHTTGGELRMRARLIRFLVEQHGVRAIALENEWETTERQIAPFVGSCEGTAEEAAMGINPVWWDVSTPALFAWLCAFNQEHPDDPVRVTGFDIRQAWYDHPALTQYLEAVAPNEADVLSAGLSTCLGVGYADQSAFFSDPTVRAYFSGATPTPEAEHQACMAGAEAATSLLLAERDALITASDERAFERARLRVVGMRAFDLSIYHLSRGQLALANPPRDAAMADVLSTMRRIDFPDARTIVFAHDGHVLRRSDEVLGGQWVGVKNLGTLVGEELGDAYFAVGQVSQTTHIDWEGGPSTLLHDQETDLEYVLGDLGYDFALINTAAAWQVTPPLWPAGKAFDVGFDVLVPENHYDALIFHRESPANTYFATPPFKQ